MISSYILCFAISYLMGTIPGAYIVGRLLGKIDIRNEGTGNVGAMNTYEVTGRKSYGILVLLIDLVKGVAALLITIEFIGNSFENLFISNISVLLGHNYNIFLKFKGGRGLATTAGCSLYLNPSIAAAWALLYLAAYYLIKRNVHAGNIVATAFTTLLLCVIPGTVITSLNVAFEFSKQQLVLLSGGICTVVMLRHIGPLRDLLKRK